MNTTAPEPEEVEEAEDKFPLISAIMIAGRTSIPDVLAGIRCFQAQTYPYKELIIVNNAKTQFDASELNIRAERDVFVVDTPQEISAGMARNIGIRAANGQILAQYDVDSYHHPQRLESQVATLAENEAHVCVLSETLRYSFVSGRASLNTNDKEAILCTMVFLRPAKIDYPDFIKHEEYGFLDRMVKADMKPIAMSKPELYCKFDFAADEPAESQINHGLTKKQFQAVKKILKDRRAPQHIPELPVSDQKTEDVENPESVTADTK